MDIEAKDAFLIKDACFIDVREEYEQPKIDSLNPIYIPLGELEENTHTIPKDKEIIIFCQSGVRSKKALEMLLQYDFQKVSHINGGAIALYNHNSNVTDHKR